MERVMRKKRDKLFVKWKGYDWLFIRLGYLFVALIKLRNLLKNVVLKNIVYDELVKKINATDSNK